MLYHKGHKGGKPKGCENNKKADVSDNAQPKKGNETKTGQNQKQNPNKKASRYCKECKTKSHWTNDCWKLKAKKENSQKKQINNASHEDCQDLHDDFGAYSNTLCVVDSRNVIIDTFLTKTASHPLVTSEPIKGCLNLENVVSLKFEVHTGASHNIISQICFDQLQNSLLRHGKEKSKSLP